MHPSFARTSLALELAFGGEAVPADVDGAADVEDAGDATDGGDAGSETSARGLLRWAAEDTKTAPQSLLDGALTATLVRVADGEGGTREALASGSVDLAPLVLGEAALDATASLALVEGAPEGVALPEGDAAVTMHVEVAGVALYDGNEGDAADANVLTIVAGSGVAPLPEACATEGAFEFKLALELPNADASAVAAGGAAAGDNGAVWAEPRRVALPPRTGAALREAAAAAGSLRAEVARYPAEEGASDPLFGKYLARAALPLEALVEPGVTEHVLSAPLALVPAAKDVEAEEDAEPAADSSAPAALLAAVEGGKPAAACDGDEALEDGAASGPWEIAGAALTLRVALARPLVAPWEAPPAPALSPETLIPKRPEAPKLPPPRAAEAFAAEIRAAARELAAEYRAMHGKTILSGGVAAPLPPGLTSERHREAVFELNRTGRYAQLKARLRAAAAGVARERFEAPKDGSVGADEARLMQHRLHTELVDVMRDALADEARPKDEVAPEPEDTALASLATERERAGDAVGAEELHARRVGGSEGAHCGAAWLAYGRFCFRQGRNGRGDECLKEAASRLRGVDDEKAATAMSSLAASALEAGRLPDAEALAHAAKDAAPATPLAWLLLALCYERLGVPKAAVDCAWEGTRLAKVAGGTRGGAWCDAAEAAGALRLPALAAACAERAAAPGAQAAAGGVALAKARAAAAGGDGASARELAAEAIASASDDGGAVVAAAHTLAGNQAAAMGDHSAAADNFAAALAAGDGDDGELLWRRGAAMLAAGGQAAASDATEPLLRACQAAPCATHWLAAGQAFAAAGDVEKAEQCLTEANTLDPLNARAWGDLAALCFRQGAVEEGARALAEARYTGLGRIDAALLAELETRA